MHRSAAWCCSSVAFKETHRARPALALPWPIQNHEIVNVTGVRTVEVGYRGSDKNKVLKEALMLTDDENIVNVQFAVQYLLSRPQGLPVQQSPSRRCRDAGGGNRDSRSGRQEQDGLRSLRGRDQIAANTQKLIQDILDRYKTGILVRSVNMQSTQPPEQVQAAFDDAVKAGQDRERQKNEGQAYANDVIPRARGAASRLMEEATGYRQRIIVTAEGDASRFKQILDGIQQGTGGDAQPYVSGDRATGVRQYQQGNAGCQGSGNLLYLPLDKLMQAAGAAVAAPEPRRRRCHAWSGRGG
jgi:membrane protease subunit HflK